MNIKRLNNSTKSHFNDFFKKILGELDKNNSSLYSVIFINKFFCFSWEKPFNHEIALKIFDSEMQEDWISLFDKSRIKTEIIKSEDGSFGIITKYDSNYTIYTITDFCKNEINNSTFQRRIDLINSILKNYSIDNEILNLKGQFENRSSIYRSKFSMIDHDVKIWYNLILSKIKSIFNVEKLSSELLEVSVKGKTDIKLISTLNLKVLKIELRIFDLNISLNFDKLVIKDVTYDIRFFKPYYSFHENIYFENNDFDFIRTYKTFCIYIDGVFKYNNEILKIIEKDLFP
jgi:hypothetical protein